MKLEKYIYEDHIKLDLKAKHKREVIEKLVSLLARKHALKDVEKIVQLLMEREELGSTGLGEGIAIPHVRDDELFDDIYVAAARTKKPVDFDAIDDKPCQIFFLVLSPKSEEKYLKVMAAISRIMRSQKHREAILDAQTKTEFRDILISNGIG